MSPPKYSPGKVDKLINKYSIDPVWYKTLLKQLIDINYNLEMAQEILLRKFPINSVIVLLQLHTSLINSTYVYNNKLIKIWNHQRLSQITRCDKCCGGYGLFAIQEHTQELLNIGYTPQNIANIAARSGVYALKMLLTETEVLLNLKYELNDISKVAMYGGAPALQIMIKLTPALLKRKYKHSQICNIAANSGGACALETVDKKTPALRKLGYKHADISLIAAHIGGTQTLETLLKHTKNLLKLKYTIQDICKISAHDSASATLIMISKHTKDLQELGYDRQDIIKIAMYKCNARAFEILLSETQNLHDMGYGISDILKIAASRKGIYALEVAIEHTPKLKELGYWVKDILMIIHSHPKDLLSIIEFEQLTATEINEQELWHYLKILANARCGRLILEKITSKPALKNYFFEKDGYGKTIVKEPFFNLINLLNQHDLKSYAAVMLSADFPGQIEEQEPEIIDDIQGISFRSEAATRSPKRGYEDIDSCTANYPFFNQNKRHQVEREISPVVFKHNK